jgi:hypothetical protein
MQSKKKSRSLSAYQFFQILQVEWLTADLRSRLYPKKDKEFWNKVKEGKEKIISQIAEKNHLPTIFSDEEMKRIFEYKMYGQEGFPTLCYKDDIDKIKQEPLDLAYYYSKGSEVRCEVFGEQKIGIIKSYQPFDLTIALLVDGETNLFEINKVTRIL